MVAISVFAVNPINPCLSFFCFNPKPNYLKPNSPETNSPTNSPKPKASPATTSETMAIVPQELSYGAAGDHALVQACGQGDRQAFRELYRRHQQKVRSTLFRLCDGADLDDLVQEVFLKAWKGLAGFRQSAQFSTWLYRITVNVATDSRRQLAQKRERQHHFSTSEQLEDMIDGAAVSRQSNPSLQNLHYQDVVHRALATLRDEHRFVLVMHDLEDMPQKEIAEMLKIPVGTVKSRLFHARGAVRQFLQAQGVEL